MTIATLPRQNDFVSNVHMASDFRSALIWHIEQNDTSILELARATGVSRDAINKVRLRDPSTTSVENALRIAAFYGKTLEEFLRMDGPPRAALLALSELLQPDEERLIEAQVRGILASRDLR